MLLHTRQAVDDIFHPELNSDMPDPGSLHFAARAGRSTRIVFPEQSHSRSNGESETSRTLSLGMGGVDESGAVEEYVLVPRTRKDQGLELEKFKELESDQIGGTKGSDDIDEQVNYNETVDDSVSIIH